MPHTVISIAMRNGSDAEKKKKISFVLVDVSGIGLTL